MWIVAIAGTLAYPASSLWAADTTPPTKPVVTATGTFTATERALRAGWTSSDPESGIAACQYQILSSSSSTPIVNWTSTGVSTSVARANLSLTQGRSYYFTVKTKNGAGLWSTPGSSNAVLVDFTPPSPPVSPIEGPSPTSRIDDDYDADGSYWVSWLPANDQESGIDTYELQEQRGPDGSWTSLGLVPSLYFKISGRPQNTRAVYRVRAKNRVGLWSDWSPPSDGILVDKTPPSPVTVSGDGLVTASRTRLHATWTAARDPESGIVDYQYQIIELAPRVTRLPVNWASVGTSTEFTRTDLPLKAGGTYYVAVRARNGSGLSSYGISMRIRVEVDTTPPVVRITYPTKGMLLRAAK